MPIDRLYVVDRIDGGRAVLMDDQGNTVTVGTRRLPPLAREGAVLRVGLGAGGEPLWKSAEVDEAETARRRAEAVDRLERLKKRDPGGDIRL